MAPPFFLPGKYLTPPPPILILPMHVHRFTKIGYYNPSLTLDKLPDSHYLPLSVSCTWTCHLRQKETVKQTYVLTINRVK